MGYREDMVALQEIKKMTREEKLQTMEFLWEELSRDEDTLESPAWHEEALREAEADIKSGKAKFIEWNEAKELIRRKTANLHEPAHS